MALKQHSESSLKPAVAGKHRNTDKALQALTAKKEKRIQVVFDEDTHQQFKMACLANGTSMSDVINEFVQTYLSENDPNRSKS